MSKRRMSRYAGFLLGFLSSLLLSGVYPGAVSEACPGYLGWYGWEPGAGVARDVTYYPAVNVQLTQTEVNNSIDRLLVTGLFIT